MNSFNYTSSKSLAACCKSKFLLCNSIHHTSAVSVWYHVSQELSHQSRTARRLNDLWAVARSARMSRSLDDLSFKQPVAVTQRVLTSSEALVQYLNSTCERWINMYRCHFIIKADTLPASRGPMRSRRLRKTMCWDILWTHYNSMFKYFTLKNSSNIISDDVLMRLCLPSIRTFELELAILDALTKTASGFLLLWALFSVILWTSRH